MAIVRWEPAREVDSLQSEVNRVFDAFFGTAGGGRVRRWVPAMDLVETDDHFVLKADLPGVAESDVNIVFENNVLTVSGERRTEHEAKKDGYYRLERTMGSFSRSLTLPEGIDADAVSAKYDNGVLEVRIPKPAEAKPRRIQIGVAGAEPQTIDSSQ